MTDHLLCQHANRAQCEYPSAEATDMPQIRPESVHDENGVVFVASGPKDLGYSWRGAS